MSLIQFKSFDKIFIYRPVVDFRCGIYGLSSIVQDQMNLVPFQSALFIFTNRNYNKLKALYWDKTGFVLWYKVLEKDRFKWPKHLEQENIIVDVKKLNQFLKGLDPWENGHKELFYKNI